MEFITLNGKFAICGLPLIGDSYVNCTFGCKYCFSMAKTIRTNHTGIANTNCITDDYVRNILKKATASDDQSNLRYRLLKEKYTIHWGVRTDPFQPREDKIHATHDAMMVLKEYDIPLLFSTKTDRIYGIYDYNPNIHSFQISVCTDKNNTIDGNAPSIDNRAILFKELKDRGFKVGIRIQPYIPGVSNIEDILSKFPDADHYTIEAIKIVPQDKEYVKEMLQMLNMKREDFYLRGLLMIKPEIRESYYGPIVDYLDSVGVSYSISDNDMRKYTNNRCCCGDALVRKHTNWNTTSVIFDNGEYDHNIAKARAEQYGEGKIAQYFTSNRNKGKATLKEYYDNEYDIKVTKQHEVE